MQLLPDSSKGPSISSRRRELKRSGLRKRKIRNRPGRTRKKHLSIVANINNKNSKKKD